MTSSSRCSNSRPFSLIVLSLYPQRERKSDNPPTLLASHVVAVRDLSVVVLQDDELYEIKKNFLEEAGLPPTKAFPLYNDRYVEVDKATNQSPVESWGRIACVLCVGFLLLPNICGILGVDRGSLALRCFQCFDFFIFSRPFGFLMIRCLPLERARGLGKIAVNSAQCKQRVLRTHSSAPAVSRAIPCAKQHIHLNEW